MAASSGESVIELNPRIGTGGDNPRLPLHLVWRTQTVPKIGVFGRLRPDFGTVLNERGF